MPLSKGLECLFSPVGLRSVRKFLKETKVTVVAFEDLIYILTQDGELLLIEPRVGAEGSLELSYAVRELPPPAPRPKPENHRKEVPHGYPARAGGGPGWRGRIA